MESKPKNLNRWKLTTAILSIVLVSVCFISLYTPEGAVSAQPHPLNVSIQASSTKLGVGELGTFTAVVTNSYSNVLAYNWSISPQDNKTVLSWWGSQCNLTFVEATEEPYLLIVDVKDDVTGSCGNADLIVYDPYTQTNLYLGASMAGYSQKVMADGRGWYQVQNGTDGSTITALSSINPTTTINGALALGGKTVIMRGAYTGASLTVPAGAELVADPACTGIQYTSIGAGARIDEPNFNGAFGGYAGGSYTIVTNQTSAATAATWYLAFEPDNSISWSSTNFDTVWNTMVVTGIGLDIYIANGTYLTSGNLIPPNYTKVTGASFTYTNIKLIDDANAAILKSTSGVRQFQMYNVQLDGNSNNQDDANYLVDFVNAQDCVFEDCQFYNSKGGGVYFHEGTTGHGYFNRINRCYFEYLTGICLKTTGTDENWYTNNNFGFSQQGAIDLNYGVDIVSGNMIGNVALGNSSTYGIRCYSSGYIIENNRFDNTNCGGIYLALSSGGSFIRNNIIGSTNGTGITVQGVSHTIISENIIADEEYAGIQVIASMNTTICNNDIYDNSGGMRYGIVEPYSAGTGHIHDNTIRAGYQAKINLVSGIGWKVENNFGYNPVGFVAYPVIDSSILPSAIVLGTPTKTIIASGVIYSNWVAPLTIYGNATSPTTVVALTINGTSVSPQLGFTVGVGQTFNITYSGGEPAAFFD